MSSARIKLETDDRELHALLSLWLSDEGYELTENDKYELRIVDLETKLPDGRAKTLYITSDAAPAASDVRENALVRPFSRLDFLESIRTHINAKSVSIRIDAERRRIYRRKSYVSLTEKEYAVFRLLYDNLDETVARDDIAAVARSGEQETNAADVYIFMLRRKLTELLGENPIKTVRGRGYMMTLR